MDVLAGPAIGEPHLEAPTTGRAWRPRTDTSEARRFTPAGSYDVCSVSEDFERKLVVKSLIACTALVLVGATPLAAARPVRHESITVTFYISSQGRAFLRSDHVSSSAGRLSSRGEAGPESRTAHFNGNQLVASAKFGSGASQLIVAFDPSYRTCTANVLVGREAGKAFTYIGFNGKRYTATGKTVVNNVTCAVRDGNALG